MGVRKRVRFHCLGQQWYLLRGLLLEEVELQKWHLSRVNIRSENTPRIRLLKNVITSSGIRRRGLESFANIASSGESICSAT
jgi:hypothetical protein